MDGLIGPLCPCRSERGPPGRLLVSPCTARRPRFPILKPYRAERRAAVQGGPPGVPEVERHNHVRSTTRGRVPTGTICKRNGPRRKEVPRAKGRGLAPYILSCGEVALRSDL
ncbi:hypothetical protein GCM10017559_64960 [Streptosporangium longisporum]|uniref:Uncharacterized protein n=1 Tax=Streptosporangium longisporum TaxID=46187 RepID=A0ABP6L169_9ACTN